MENNNGRGIFYGVIGVATLVVAIIGATFAYFSASATAANAVNVGSTKIELSLTDSEETTNFYQTLIPVDSEHSQFGQYPGFTAGTGKGHCTDDNGNPICGVYSFTVTNTSTAAQTVYGSFKTTTSADKQFANLKYALFKGTPTDWTVVDRAQSICTGEVCSAIVFKEGAKVSTAANGALVVGATAVPSGATVHGYDNGEGLWANTQQLLASGASQTYTMLVWLENINESQTADELKKFLGTITFDTGSGTGVSGVLGTA